MRPRPSPGGAAAWPFSSPPAQPKEIPMSTTTPLTQHPVVSRDRWIAERKTLLAHEKELTHLRDRIAEERRALPWVRLEQDYVFDTVDGPRKLSELFQG